MKQNHVTKIALLATLVASLLAPASAHAGPKNMAGGLLLLTGGVMTLTAFNYHTGCPAGYSTHTAQGLPTECVYISPSGDSDVINEPTSANLARPMVLKIGIAAAVGGTVLLLLPKRAAKIAPELSITPTGWQVSKTLTLGKGAR